MFVLLLAPASCVRYEGLAPDRPAEVSRRDPGARLTSRELEDLTNIFADNYVARVASACDHIIERTADPARLADATYLKSVTAVAAYDLATEFDAVRQLFDLMTLVNVQHLVWVEERAAEATFGPDAAELVEAFADARTEARQLASRVLTPEQIRVLEDRAVAWRRENPGVRFVAMIRLEQEASDASRALETQVREGGGLMAPVSAAVDSLERGRLLAERTFFVAKRLPMLVGWQLDHVVTRSLHRPDLRATFEAIQQTAVAAREIAGELRSLRALAESAPTAALDELDKRARALGGPLDESLTRLERALEAGRSLADQSARSGVEVRTTVESAERLLSRLDSSGVAGSQARSLEELTAAVDRVALMAKEINQALASGEELLVSQAWRSRIDDVNAATKERLEQTTAAAAAVTDRAFWRVLMAIGALLVAGIVYKTYAVWLTKRAG